MEGVSFTQDATLVGFMLAAIWWLVKYFIWKEKDCALKQEFYEKTIKELLDINTSHADNVRKLNECIKENEGFMEFWKWWKKTHVPTVELCTTCLEYTSCPHPNKPILKSK